MNKQLSIHSGSHAWQIDSATRRRGRRGVAEARELIRQARVRDLAAASHAATTHPIHHADSSPSASHSKVTEAA